MRSELENLNYDYSNPFEVLDIFEKKLANFFGSKYCVLVDSCTHAIELCLRSIYDYRNDIGIPLHTYMSVPMTLHKLEIPYFFQNKTWEKYYQLGNTFIYDAATLWETGSYIKNTLMCLSFQHKKHLKIGRGGAVLLDDKHLDERLRKMRYDGRDLSMPHHEDKVTTIGYHYYMTPEDAALGIMLFDKVFDKVAKIWTDKDYQPLSQHPVFKNIKIK